MPDNGTIAADRDSLAAIARLIEAAYRLGHSEAKVGCMSLAVSRDELAQMAALEPDSKAIAEIVSMAGAAPAVDEQGIPY